MQQVRNRLTDLWCEILHYKNLINNLEAELQELQDCNLDLECTEQLILNKLDEYECIIFNDENEIREILRNNYKLY